MRLQKTILLLCLSVHFLSLQGQVRDRAAYIAEAQVYENNALDQFNIIDIYPNPSIDYLVVNISNSNLVNTKFEIHSVIGNDVDVIVEAIGKDRYRIDVKEFASGYYFLVIKDENSQFKRALKFLKK